MELKRSCRLVLKSTDLSLGTTTNIGTMDGFRTTFTWSNLNLRMLMGDMYNQYDYFNLCLNCVATSQASAAAGAGVAEDRLVYIKISGLPFINQTYQQSTGNNGVFSNIGVYQIPMTAITNYLLYTNPANVNTFNKDQDQANITISLFRVFDDTKPALTANFPHFAFFFTIVGIDKPDNPDKPDNLMKLR